jgi:hypothetical protein
MGTRDKPKVFLATVPLTSCENMTTIASAFKDKLPTC